MKKTAFATIMAAFAGLMLTTSCIGDIYLLSDGTDPLKEYTISEGPGRNKILLIPLNGTISMEPREQDMFTTRPGMVQEVVSQLNKAELDSSVKAVVLLINSPGGTVTASDLIYNEVMSFKERTGVKVYAMMLDMAASGGYYAACAADEIFALPTTLTGSVGVIFMRPDISGLMKIIGVKVGVSKSGEFKDMGSPFKESSGEEDLLFENLVMSYADLFYQVVRKRRPAITDEDMKTIRTARVFTAGEAKKLGMIDDIAYLRNVLMKAAADTDAFNVTVYRRLEYKNDNPYIMESGSTVKTPQLINTGVIGKAAGLDANFYYIWPSVLP